MSTLFEHTDPAGDVLALHRGHAPDGSLSINATHRDSSPNVEVDLDETAAAQLAAALLPPRALVITLPAGPAVAFDPAAAREWLTAEVEGDEGDSVAATAGIAPAEPYDRDACEPGSWVEYLTAVLGGWRTDNTVWRTPDGVNVAVHELADSDDQSGALVVVELRGGIRLASIRMTARDLVTARPGLTELDAAVEALAVAAATANAILSSLAAQAKA